MFDLVVFTQYPPSYGLKRFRGEAEKLGLTCKIKSYKYTGLQNLPQAKYVILREPTASRNMYGLRDEILKYYLKEKIPVLNSESYLKWSILDKLTQHTEFGKYNIPHIEKVVASEAEFPFVAKAKLGSHGSHVFKITNKEDLERVLARYQQNDLLFQEFQTSGFDVRAIVIDSKVLGIMKRTPRSGQFLSNYSQGGLVEKYIGSDEATIKEIAIRVALQFKLGFAGVDLMKGNDGEWKVLEVNRACQFRGFEKAIGINVASKIIKYLL